MAGEIVSSWEKTLTKKSWQLYPLGVSELVGIEVQV